MLTCRELRPETRPPITTTGPRTAEAAAHHASKMKSRAVLSPPLCCGRGLKAEVCTLGQGAGPVLFRVSKAGMHSGEPSAEMVLQRILTDTDTTCPPLASEKAI